MHYDEATKRVATAAGVELPAEWGDEFWEVAGLLGHDPERLRAGEEIRSRLRIPTLPEARGILSRADAAARRLRAQTFFDAIRSRQRLGQGLHDRGEAVVWAEGTTPDADDETPGETR